MKSKPKCLYEDGIRINGTPVIYISWCNKDGKPSDCIKKGCKDFTPRK